MRLEEIQGYPLRYGRDDVSFDGWYSDWMKRLALTKTRGQLLRDLGIAKHDGERAGRQHLRAIEKRHSMQSNSQARAQTGNVASAAGDTRLAILGALEIYELFPEHTLDGAGNADAMLAARGGK